MNNQIAELISYNRRRFIAYKEGKPFEINKDFERMLNSRKQKVGRIKRRLLFLINRYQYIWFCTFTINDSFINKSERTKRDKVKSVLDTHDFKYILHVDYGKQGTKRQHYHCIVATNINMDINQYFQSQLNDSFGWTLSLRCLSSTSDLARLSKYIDKLSNHCIKATTNNQRLVYNFKGYDKFCPDSASKTLQYKLEFYYLQCVTLLDKGDTTGNFSIERS